MKPINVIKTLANFIGKKGVICGGCCRDIYLGRVPKDYDIFLYNRGNVHNIGKKLQGQIEYEGDNGVIYNALLKNHAVQLIYNERLGSAPTSIVATFPFTVCQFWYDINCDKIVATQSAKEALRDRKLIFNKQGHIPGLSGNQKIRIFLVLRATYLANKLGFQIPPSSIAEIYEKYDN